MSAPFRVGAVVELSSPQWGTRERWPDGPCTGERYVISRHDDTMGASYIRDDKDQEWLVSAHQNSIWHVVPVFEYPAVHNWANAVNAGLTLLGYEEWAKERQTEALGVRPRVGQEVGR